LYCESTVPPDEAFWEFSKMLSTIVAMFDTCEPYMGVPVELIVANTSKMSTNCFGAVLTRLT
jgi:hypothetical protein